MATRDQHVLSGMRSLCEPYEIGDLASIVCMSPGQVPAAANTITVFIVIFYITNWKL